METKTNKVGRPRKEEAVGSTEPNYTHKAFGIHKSKNGEWVVSELRYNPSTGDISPEIKEEFNSIGNRDGAIEAFKLTVVKSGLFGDM